MATADEEIDPLAAEQARLAVTNFRRTVVHAAHADEERALIEWSKRNRQARAKIRKRRDVQFETFKFAQKRLSDNRDALQQLDERVRETNRLGLAKRRQIDDEAAAMAAQQAQEMLIIDAAARASEEERLALQDFAERRESTQAELVATHALCEDLERQRRQEQEDHSKRVARDKRQLEKTAEEALLAARRAELAKTKARLSRNTRQQVVEMERMDGEMVLHREEMVRFCVCSMAWSFHAIDARLPPFLRLLDGVQVDKGHDLAHCLVSTQALRNHATRKEKRTLPVEHGHRRYQSELEEGVGRGHHESWRPEG